MTIDAPPRPGATRSFGIPAVVAVLTGVLAVGAAVGIGHLVAGWLSPASSPYIAVADTVIRLSPQWLTEFGKSFGPERDKLVLKLGVAVVLAAVAAITGLIGRSRPRVAVRIILGLGAVGLLAVIFGPTFTVFDLLAPAVTAVVGVVAFNWLHERSVQLYFDPPDPTEGISRRTMLIGSGAAIGVLGLGAGALGEVLGRGVADSRAEVTVRLRAITLAERAPAIPATAAFPELGTPSFITPNASFYRIDTALRIPNQSAADWKLRIHGKVDRELQLDFDDLLARPLVERAITMTCVSNPVGGDLISTATFLGVELRDVLLEAGVHPDADMIFTTSTDGWTAGTPTDVVLEPGRGALLVVGMNGEALPAEHGFPVRMVVPGLYGYVSGTKWIADMELTTFATRSAYWTDRGWSEKGPIKTEVRIDTPRWFGNTPSGKVAIAGIAWSQPTGIGKVEVRMNGGPWQEAELGAEVSRSTWRMWHTEFTVGAGTHTVQARATDRDGVTQTEAQADVVPDGATGWPATIFTAT